MQVTKHKATIIIDQNKTKQHQQHNTLYLQIEVYVRSLQRQLTRIKR